MLDILVKSRASGFEVSDGSLQAYALGFEDRLDIQVCSLELGAAEKTSSFNLVPCCRTGHLSLETRGET